MIGWWAGVALGGWPAISPPPGPQGLGGADAAVVVAVEDYAYVQDVPGAVDNGTAWVRWLRESRGVPLVRFLRDQDGTREAMIEAAEGAAERTGAGGTVWIVFIGHGGVDPGGRGPLLVGADAQATAPSLSHRGLALEALLDAVSHRRAVVVVDACFSGQTPDGAPLLPGVQPMVPSWIAARSGATVLAAAAADQVAGPLPGAQRPAFSYLVLGALRGWGDADADGSVTASEAVRWSGRVLFEQVGDRLQEPQLSGPDRVLSVASERSPWASGPSGEPARRSPGSESPHELARTTKLPERSGPEPHEQAPARAAPARAAPSPAPARAAPAPARAAPARAAPARAAPAPVRTAGAPTAGSPAPDAAARTAPVAPAPPDAPAPDAAGHAAPAAPASARAAPARAVPTTAAARGVAAGPTLARAAPAPAGQPTRSDRQEPRGAEPGPGQAPPAVAGHALASSSAVPRAEASPRPRASGPILFPRARATASARPRRPKIRLPRISLRPRDRPAAPSQPLSPGAARAVTASVAAVAVLLALLALWWSRQVPVVPDDSEGAERDGSGIGREQA